MPDQIERKFINWKSLNVVDEGPGFIEGNRAIFGEIDEGGDLIVKGFFQDTIDEYLRLGFSAHSHDWDFDKAIGFPVDAKETDEGFFVKSQFHSTPDAQNVRIKARERMEAGKQVGFSFGYKVTTQSVIESKDFKDQLPLYIKPERLQVNLLKAQKFDRVRILKKGEVIEDSIVTAPMNRMAAATAIKSAEQKGLLADEMAETTPSWWQVESAFYRLVRKIAEGAKNSDVTGEFDWRAKINQLGTEFGTEASAIAIIQVEEFLNSSDDEFHLKDSVPDSLESFDDVVAALEKQTANMQRNHEVRVKDGRVLSATNRAKVQAAYDALGALLEASEVKPKEKALDMVAFRTQHDRVEHRLMSLLTQ